MSSKDNLTFQKIESIGYNTLLWEKLQQLHFHNYFLFLKQWKSINHKTILWDGLENISEKYTKLFLSYFSFPNNVFIRWRHTCSCVGIGCQQRLWSNYKHKLWRAQDKKSISHPIIILIWSSNPMLWILKRILNEAILFEFSQHWV